MTAVSATRSGALFGHPPFLADFAPRGVSEFAYQMARRGGRLAGLCADPQRLDLGLVDLMQFVPTALATLLAGQVAGGAAVLGAVPAAVQGELGTVWVAVLRMQLVPGLCKVERLE